MLTETGTISAIEKDAIIVQVVQQTTCGSCVAQKGCGQGVLTKYLSGSQFIRVSLRHRPLSDFHVGDQIELGIDELAMLRAAFLVYLTPVFAMIGGAYLGSMISEAASIFGAIAGMLLGGLYVRTESLKRMDNPDYSPIVVDDRAVVRILNTEQFQS